MKCKVSCALRGPSRILFYQGKGYRHGDVVNFTEAELADFNAQANWKAVKVSEEVVVEEKTIPEGENKMLSTKGKVKNGAASKRNGDVGCDEDVSLDPLG